MFTTSNLSCKYKSYTKTLKLIKNKFTQLNKQTVLNAQNSFQNTKASLENCSKITSAASNTHVSLKNKDNSITSKRSVPKLLNQCKVDRKWMKYLQNRPLLGAVAISSTAVESTIESTKSATVAAPVIEALPEPPPIPAEIATQVVETLNALGEPTLNSLGLAGWSPVGIVQQCLEYLHVTMDLPWWGAIAIGTVVVRILMFPLVIVAQRNGAKMNNHLPQLQVLQLKMTEARQSGNQLDAARYSQEMMLFMKEKQLNPLKNMVVPLAQMPVFLSFFMGLRGMCNVPVHSLTTGGIFWFTDLTLPDQYFALPIITSLTLWLTVEIGTDSAKLSAQNMQVMKYILRAMPVVILPFTVNFPGAILCYWVSSNFISLLQVGFLKIPKVRDYFKIDPLVSHDQSKLPMKSKGFVGGVKDSWTNMKIARDLEERRRVDELQFQRAGKGPIQKTFKFDPTKQSEAVGSTMIQAKKR